MRDQAPHNGREAPQSLRTRILGFLELSTFEGRAGLWFTLGLFVLCGGPMVLLSLLDVSGTPRRLLGVMSPVAICVGLAALILYLGLRYGEALQMSRLKTWTIAVLTVALGVAGGVGIWFSEG